MAVRARVLRASGKDVISLSQGEPDFSTPKVICEGAKMAIDSGKYTAYPPTAGYTDLRAAIASKYARDNGVNYRKEHIVVCNGAKQALFHALFSLLNPGDEVIILGPYWVSHLAQIELIGAGPVVLVANLKRGSG